MKRRIEINKKKFEYELQRRRGTRCVRLAIYSDGNFVVSAPRWYPLYVIRKFLEDKSEWIWEKLGKINFEAVRAVRQEEDSRYKAGKKSAKELIQSKLEFFNQHYNFSYNRVSVKNQKTCWGSASRKGNLNFNYKIANLPEELQDYITVHELCHLKELNHSRNFWKLVEETVPAYRELRKKLKNYSKQPNYSN
ncbi:MAG: hypothetical protein CO141_03115 [Candidatus Moranbacteria bacterium CG_4_9_14_3_um_filter_42_9]|nr:MAG: hypothetical protein CO141_03115 [Candidatus Moranbacteria bacterium CG_4_9_14_3_um_filter_42_9]